MAAIAARPARRRDMRRMLGFFMSGLVISVAMIDPANLESDFQAGGQHGLSLLWVILWSTAAAWFLQGLAVRLALGSGMHLARACREEFRSKHARILLWLVGCPMSTALFASACEHNVVIWPTRPLPRNQ